MQFAIANIAIFAIAKIATAIFARAKIANIAIFAIANCCFCYFCYSKNSRICNCYLLFARALFVDLRLEQNSNFTNGFGPFCYFRSKNSKNSKSAIFAVFATCSSK